jgi:uncharacterized damage-inducible protein DinB
MGSSRAMDRSSALARRLRVTTAAIVAVVESVDDDRWNHVPSPGVWSIGKEAEHVAEAAIYHQWIVRLTVGATVPSRRPAIERQLTTTALSPAQVVALIRRRAEEGEQLLLTLSDDQLDLPTRPPRAQGERLLTTIERVLVGHVDVHRAAIEAKLGPR